MKQNPPHSEIHLLITRQHFKAQQPREATMLNGGDLDHFQQGRGSC